MTPGYRNQAPIGSASISFVEVAVPPGRCRRALSGYCAPTRGVAIEIGVVVFDVNETLLRLDTLRAGVLLAAPGVSLNTWFARILQNAMAASIADQYAPFDEQAIDALIEEASGVGAEVDRSVARQVVAGFKELAPHSDARPALDTLSTAGFRLAALSNSSTVFLNAQIAHSGLDGYFERLISVDEIHRFKPDAEVYRHAAAELEVHIGSMWMVAAHDWDIAGAIRAGARGAYVNRRGGEVRILAERPDIVGAGLEDVARQLIEMGQD